MVPGIIAGLGVLQAGLGAATRAKGLKGLREAEKMFKPYEEDSSVTDYYNRQKALASTSGMESVEGRLAQQQMDRNLLTGLRQTKGQRGRDVSAIMRSAQDSTSNLLGRLAAQRRASTAALGGATQMKLGEKMKAYKYNVLDPANRRYGLEGQRAAEGSSMIGSGLRNAISGLSDLESENDGGGGGTKTAITRKRKTDNKV